MPEYRVICPLTDFYVPWNVRLGPQKLTNEEWKNLIEERKKQLTEGIDLVEGIKLKFISKTEIEDIKALVDIVSSGLSKQLSTNLIVLAGHIDWTTDQHIQIAQKIEKIILAFRLFKSGYFYCNHLFGVSKQEKSRMAETIFWDEQPIVNHIDYNPYSLNFEELPEFKNILEMVYSIDFSKRKSFHLACNRFQRAYSDVNPEDRLIDLMIAFEALFLKGNKGAGGIRQKIADACSDLLGKDEEEKEEIRADLKEAYSIRNCIVHGTEYYFQISEEGFTFSDFVNDIENYLREALKKLLT